MSIYCAREFSALDIQTIRDLINQDPKLQRSALSRKLCELWGWTKPNGDLKDMTCRVALLRMRFLVHGKVFKDLPTASLDRVSSGVFRQPSKPDCHR